MTPPPRVARSRATTATGPHPVFEETEEASSLLFELTSGPRYRGGLDGWKDGVLSGWAIDVDRSSAGASRLRWRRGGGPWRYSRPIGIRRDLAALFPDNVAGFALELASLPAETLAEIERALGEAPADEAARSASADAPARPRWAAYRSRPQRNHGPQSACAMPVGARTRATAARAPAIAERISRTMRRRPRPRFPPAALRATRLESRVFSRASTACSGRCSRAGRSISASPGRLSRCDS